MEYIAVNATVQFMLCTNAAAGNRVAPSSAFVAADFECYKDGSTARGNTAGYTVTSPVNSKTGLHNIAVDTSDNTVAGFFAAGHKYTVHLYPASTTVDSQAPGALVGEFIIGPVTSNVLQIAGTVQTAKDVGNALPAAAPNASGGIPTVGTGSGQINPSNGKVTTTYGIVKNTLFNNFEFQMVLSSDHVSPATGKTVAVQRSIDGGAYADCTNTPASEVSNGTYKINLSAADLNGNMISLKMTATGCDTTIIGIVTQS